jgi:hypothetical protein
VLLFQIWGTSHPAHSGIHHLKSWFEMPLQSCLKQKEKSPEPAGYMQNGQLSWTTHTHLEDAALQRSGNFTGQRALLGARTAYSVQWLDHRLDARRIVARFPPGPWDCLFPTASRPALQHTQPPPQWVPGALSPGMTQRAMGEKVTPAST